MIAIIVMLVMATVVGAALYLGVKAYSRALLGPIDLSTSTRRAYLGEPVAYQIKLAPKGNLQVRRMLLHCVAYEWIQWTEDEDYKDSDGESRTRTVTKTRTHELLDMQQSLMAGEPLKSDEPVSLDGSFRIPVDGPPSMEARDNAIRWCLRLVVDIEGLPDVTETYDFEVRPFVLVEDD